MKEIIFYARGGQGAVTAASVLVTALAQEGKYSQGSITGGDKNNT